MAGDWTDDIFKAFSWNAAQETPTILAAWEALDAYIDDMVAAILTFGGGVH